MSIIVAGAGCAGISTVGALIQQGFKNIVWIDPQFEGGAMNEYDGVPSNTKAKNLAKYATHLHIFHKYDTPETTVNVFDRLQPENQTTLNQLKQCLDRMTSILRYDFKNKVTLIKGSVTNTIQQNDNTFVVQTDSTQHPTFHAKLIFLCLGGQLKSVQKRTDLPRINCFDIMSVKKIQNYDLKNDICQVHGSSHSAVLCLRNLTRMKNPPKKIYHIMNKKNLLHAQYDGDFIRHDTIGLKGVSSQFGKDYQNGKYKDYIVTQYTWQDTKNKDSTQIIEAIRFKSRSFNFVSKDQINQYETKQGFVYVKGNKVDNLHLIGLMSPQFFIDKQGQRMPAVGVDKFLCYVLQILSKQSINATKSCQ